MPTPKFILDLRAKIGHDLLWLSGLTAVVLNDAQEVLLVKRADDGRWSLVAGILEPGEQPAVAAIREVQEETAVEVVVDRLLSIETLPPSSYPNGDQVQFLDLCFRCRVVRGEPRVNDDESVDVRWWPLDELPDLLDREREYIQRALAPDAETAFVKS
jgi:8-oxo-dGTP pyrophosphatase MutT (NUDIX family)